MKKFLINFLATAFGLGYSPIAPGTATSFVAAAFFYFFSSQISIHNYIFLTFFLFIAGVPLTGEANKLIGEKDNSKFSFDEVPGQMITFLPLFYFKENFLFFVILGFLLFRFFDIVKPGFIKKSEKIEGGLGVMLDDILSGIASAFCLQIVIILT